MKSIVTIPYLYFWIMIPVYCFMLIFFGNHSMDIQLHDTYYVISMTHVWLFLIWTFSLFGLVYWSVRKLKTYNWITAIHVLATLSMVFLLFSVDRIAYFRQDHFYSITMIFGLIFSLAQILFVLNILFSLLRRIVT